MLLVFRLRRVQGLWKNAWNASKKPEGQYVQAAGLMLGDFHAS